MKEFVLLYTSGDGCTWSSDNVVPVACESEEALYVKLHDAVVDWVRKGRPSLRDKSLWHGIDLSDFIYSITKDEYLSLKQQGNSDIITQDGFCFMLDLPEIMTLEAWFKENSSAVP